MTLEQYAYLAEIIGAIAVIASLLYLAVQIRQNNAQDRATARYAFVGTMSEINLSIVRDKSVASIFRRGLESTEDLDDDEQLQLWMLIGQCGNTWSVMYELYQERMLPESQWWVVRKDILSLFASKGGSTFWELFGADAFEPSFVEFVNSLLKKEKKSYDLLAR